MDCFGEIEREDRSKSLKETLWILHWTDDPANVLPIARTLDHGRGFWMHLNDILRGSNTDGVIVDHSTTVCASFTANVRQISLIEPVLRALWKSCVLNNSGERMTARYLHKLIAFKLSSVVVS